MSLLRFIVAWANAPFTIVGGIAVVFALVQATGLLGLFGDHDADVDHDADLDADGDADADADHDADGDHDEAGWSHAVFAAFGFGTLPFSVIWQSFAIVFAVTGLALNAHYLALGAPPLVSLAWTLPSGFVSGAAVVAVLARLFGPVFATKPHEATTRAELVGHAGVVISSKVDAEFGEVRIRDKSGLDLRVVCRIAPGVRAAREHENVVVVDYENGALLVAPVEGDEQASVVKP